jgi:hypothetical protein
VTGLAAVAARAADHRPRLPACGTARAGADLRAGRQRRHAAGRRAAARGQGLPIGGDLRVAQFIGIHAGQVLPVIGSALAMRLRRGAVAGVWLAAAVWTWLWAVTLAQALQG